MTFQSNDVEFFIYMSDDDEEDVTINQSGNPTDTNSAFRGKLPSEASKSVAGCPMAATADVPPGLVLDNSSSVGPTASNPMILPGLGHSSGILLAFQPPSGTA